MVADPDRLPLPQLQPIGRAVFGAPIFELLVHSRGFDLQQISQHRHTAWPGKIFVAAQRLLRRSGGLLKRACVHAAPRRLSAARAWWSGLPWKTGRTLVAAALTPRAVMPARA